MQSGGYLDPRAHPKGAPRRAQAHVRQFQAGDMTARPASDRRAWPSSSTAWRRTIKPRNTAVFRLVAAHPDSAERAQRFRDGSRTADPVLTAEEWQAIKTMCKR